MQAYLDWMLVLLVAMIIFKPYNTTETTTLKLSSDKLNLIIIQIWGAKVSKMICNQQDLCMFHSLDTESQWKYIQMFQGY